MTALLAIKKYYAHVEEVRQQLKETAKEAKSAIDEINSSFKTLSSNTNDVKERYAELAQGVENLGKINQSRGTLSTDDYEEFLDLSNQLAKLFPQLTVGYDDNGNAILNLSGNVNTIVGSLNNLVDVQQKLANQEILEKMPDVWAGYIVELEEYNKELKTSQDSINEFQKSLKEIPDSQTIDISVSDYSNFLNKAIHKAGISDTVLQNALKSNYTRVHGYSYLESYTLDIQKLTESEKNALLGALGELSSEYNNAVQLVKGNIASANSDMSSYINTWLSGEWNYSKMDSSLQNVIKDVLLNTDWVEALPSDVNSNDWDEVSNWLQRNFLYAVNDIDNEQIKSALVDAFNGAFTTESLQEIINQLTSNEYGFTEDNPLMLYLQTKLTERTEIVDDVKDKLQDEFDDRVEELTLGDLQIAANLKVPEGTLLSWDELIAKIEEVKNMSFDVKPLTFDITTYKDSIDDFQAKLKTLGDTLSSIQSGNFEDSDLTDLLQEFPELADKTDDLETAIVELINNALQALYDTLGEDIPDGLKTSLQDLANIASGTAKHLGDAFSDIHDSWDILHDFKETMDKGFDSNVTDSLLQSVRKLSGELETLVAGYYSGVVSAEQLYEALTQHYENDLHNYSEALIKKNELNEDFYNAVGLASEEVTNQFMNDYDVDIKNCKTYNQAKIAIEEQTLGQVSGMWSQYYDAQSKTLKTSLSLLKSRAKRGDDGAVAFLEQYKLIENYEAAMEALNNITYDGIRSNFEGIGSKLSANSRSSSEKDFEETFDWIETAIDRIERSVSYLDLKTSSVYRSWSERNSNLKAELLDVKKQMDIQASGYNKYMQQANSVGLSEEWASKVRNGQIDINSITDKALAERIKEYQDWYRNMPPYLVTGGGILFNC